MTRRKVLVTGAAGTVAGKVLPGLREQYDLVLLDKTLGLLSQPSSDVQVSAKLEP